MTVENLVEFLVTKQERCSQEPCPIVLYGEPGAGKSSVLRRLACTLTEQQTLDHFCMVVRVEDVTATSKELFWQIFADRCRQSIKKHGYEEVRRVLFIHASKVLFLVDCNLRDDQTLNDLIRCMDRGLWVVSFQGVPEHSTRFHSLRVAPLSEEQVQQVLLGIEISEEDRRLVSDFCKRCECKELISIPVMVRFFAENRSELQNCVSLYKLVEHYIYKKIERTEQNEALLIKLGGEAFRKITKNDRYCLDNSPEDLKRVSRPFLERDPSGRYFFKYMMVEHYLVAKYIVDHPGEACQSWLEQATLFKMVFQMVCDLWAEQVDGIQTNLHHIKEYLQKMIVGDKPQKNKGKKRKRGEIPDEVTDYVNTEDTFVRWVCLSKIAKHNQDREEILRLLADILTQYNTWFFNHTSLTAELLDSLSRVLSHVKLTKELTIKMKNGTNVEAVSKLWSTLIRHRKLLRNSHIYLDIQYNESKVAESEPHLAAFFAEIHKTEAPPYIKHYAGPLPCSATQRFFKCSSMKKLEKLNVYISNMSALAALGKILERKHNLSIVTRVRVKSLDTDWSRITLSCSPPDLTVVYFKDLQMLLNSFEQPESLRSLKIHEVYIHNTFNLDFTRFTELEFLSIRFVEKEKEGKVDLLPLDNWAPHLMKHLRLPERVGRLMMRNLPFFNDSIVPDLVEYFKKLTFQRLVLLDTDLSISKFKEFMTSLLSSSSTVDMDESLATSPCEAVTRRRLVKAEREARRKSKPEGKELVITSEADLFKYYQFSENDYNNACHNLVSLVRAVDSCKALSINYSGKDKCVSVRKDMCGDLFVQCPQPLLDDEAVQSPVKQQWLELVLGALALGERISLHNTHLSHSGALCLMQLLKERIKNLGRTEPFKLTIFSNHLSICSKSKEEVKNSSFMREIKKEDRLAQFNFSCRNMCHFFKKATDGSIYFNGELLKDTNKK